MLLVLRGGMGVAVGVALSALLTARQAPDAHDHALHAMHDFAHISTPKGSPVEVMVLLLREQHQHQLPDPMTSDPGLLQDHYHPIWPAGTRDHNSSVGVGRKPSIGDLCDTCHRNVETGEGEYELVPNRVARMLEAGPANLPLRGLYLFSYTAPCESCLLQMSRSLRGVLVAFGYPTLDIYIGFVEDGNGWYRKSRLGVLGPQEGRGPGYWGGPGGCRKPELKANTYVRQLKKLRTPKLCQEER